MLRDRAAVGEHLFTPLIRRAQLQTRLWRLLTSDPVQLADPGTARFGSLFKDGLRESGSGQRRHYVVVRFRSEDAMDRSRHVPISAITGPWAMAARQFSLVDHLVGAGDHSRWDVERLRSLGVDSQPQIRWHLHW